MFKFGCSQSLSTVQDTWGRFGSLFGWLRTWTHRVVWAWFQPWTGRADGKSNKNQVPEKFSPTTNRLSPVHRTHLRRSSEKAEVAHSKWISYSAENQLPVSLSLSPKDDSACSCILPWSVNCISEFISWLESRFLNSTHNLCSIVLDTNVNPRECRIC